mgnify:CR=1 FL=1
MAGCERVDLPDSVSEELRAFIKGTQGWTKLHYASYMGNFHLVSSVLHEGVGIDFTAERGTGKYKCKPIDAVKIKENTSSWKKDLDRENVVNIIRLLQVAMDPFQLHLAMAYPYLYQQAWSQDIRNALFQAQLCNCFRKTPEEIREQAKDFENKEKRSLWEEMARNREKNQSTAIRKVFEGGEEDVWGIILSFVANHNDAPIIRQKLAEESETVQAQEAVEVGQASPEEVSVAP